MVRMAQKKAARPTPPRNSETGIRMAMISIYFSLMAFRHTVIDDSDIARAKGSGVAWLDQGQGHSNNVEPPEIRKVSIIRRVA